MEVELPYCQKINIGGVYREFDFLKTQLDRNNYSTTDQQEERLRKFLKQWAAILDLEKEVITTGDFKIDLLEDTSRSYVHKRLYRAYNISVRNIKTV